MVRRPDRDPHRRRQAVPGHRRGPCLATAARLRDQRASRLGGRQGGAVHGRRRARRPRRRRRVPHRQRRRIHRRRSSPRPADTLGVTQSMGRVGSALDNAAAESCELDPRARAALPATLRHQGPGPPRGRRVHRRLQPSAPPQQLRDAPAGRLRTDPRRPTGTGRLTTINNPPRLRGKPRIDFSSFGDRVVECFG